MLTKLLLVGSGGHAKVVVDAVEASMPKTDIILADENTKIIGHKMFGKISIELLGSWQLQPKYVHISIGNNKARADLFLRADRAMKKLITITHPSAQIAREAQVGKGCFIAANAIISSEASIAQGCIVNHAAIVDHDCKIDAFSHIAPNVTLGGGVLIGSQCLIGTGASVLPGITIGDNVIVAAGAVVTKNILANNVVIGIPAKCVKK